MSDFDERALIERCRKGDDERAFGELVDRYKDLVYGMVIRLSADRSQVDDLAQDVWVEAWQYLLRGNEVRKPHGLLALMARTRVCRHYQSARVRREQAVDFQDYELAVDRLASWIGAAA